MKPPVQIGLLLLCLGAAATAAETRSAVMVESLSPFQPVLGGSAFSEAGEGGGNVFSVFPLNRWLGWDGGVQDRVLFLEPLINWQEGGAYSGSLGLGYRQLFGDPTKGKSRLSKDIDLLGEGWYLGGNVFLDGMNSVHDQGHWQISSGVEIGSRYVTVNANYYWPLTDGKRWGHETVEQRIPNQTAYELNVGPPHAAPGLFGTYQTVHDITVSKYHRQMIREFDLYDEALRGWDANLTLLVPGIDKHVDLRLVGGLYGFGGGSVGDDFSGWRAGIEFRPVPSIVLMAEQFNDDRFEESQWLAGVRFEIPLGGGASDWLRVRKRTLQERLVEPVNRRYTPAVAEGRKLLAEKVGREPRSFSVESLNLQFVPMAGDVLQLQDGTLLVVEADGKTLREVTGKEKTHLIGQGVIVVVPEPGRTLLMLIGLSACLFRRRRSA